MISNDFLLSRLILQGAVSLRYPDLPSNRNVVFGHKNNTETPWKSREVLRKELPIISPPRGNDYRLLSIFPFNLYKIKNST